MTRTDPRTADPGTSDPRTTDRNAADPMASMPGAGPVTGSPDGFAAATVLIMAAAVPVDLFGAGDEAATYRRLVKIVHPDRVPPAARGAAQAAFERLTALWDAYRGRTVTTFATPRHTFTVRGGVAYTGDIADLHAATCPADGTGRDPGPVSERDVLVKIARRPGSNDLLSREAIALRRIARDGDPAYRDYVPRLVDSFIQRDADTGIRRAANVIERATGFVPLTGVAAAYPGGVDPLDAAWMWRRLLVALGYAHKAGVVHGAVVPDHVLIHPAAHGLVLVDWCYSVTTGGDTGGTGTGGDTGGDSGTVPAIVARYSTDYPPEVAARRPATPATDIHLATRTIANLMGPRITEPLRRFVRGCTLTSPAARPGDAWKLLTELDELLERLYGPRRFRPFALPPKP